MQVACFIIEKIFVIIVAVLVVVGVLWGTGNFSIIGELGTQNPSCIIEDPQGGSCTINMTLPEYREAKSYTFDLEFESMAGPYSEEVIVAPYWTYAGYEEWDNEDPSAEEGYGKYWVYREYGMGAEYGNYRPIGGDKPNTAVA